ncbi:hypothetical protein XACJK48_8240007 [Xanthomonas citri pv. citri]|nr:hypothetical protein XAC3615_12260003 [Xanthomonas citri pv. citri]CEH56661.1 hypothetical protein XACJK48_8240007 [Xanthomonas citri pv. citri]
MQPADAQGGPFRYCPAACAQPPLRLRAAKSESGS